MSAAKVVNADPTKAFFISMLVRDISLIPAIVDLVDNAVDGARRLRPRPHTDSDTSGTNETSPPSRFDGLWINVRTAGDHFEISDNCGGIPWEIAENYAFRFGRPDEAPETPNSIGQFGIGMKRALFKLGGSFSVESRTSEEQFTLRVDVDAWRKTKLWVFPDVDYSDEGVPSDECGTTVRVEKLHAEVSETFGETPFRSSLTRELSKAHQATINDGLAITLNGLPINVDVQTLLSGGGLNPAHLSEILDADSGREVHVEILAGIDISSPADAGWYVYCNGRHILGPDRTEITGWGEGKGKTIPQYHNQFARFRGYVFFESADVEKLPWTTTKDGIDRDHRVFRAIRPRMIQAARPVIDFLNALDMEKDHPVTDTVSLESVVSTAERHRTAISSLPLSERFVSPTRIKMPKRPETQSIQYRKPISQIDAVKSLLGVTSAADAGSATFDYYYRRELGSPDDE